MRVPPVSVVLPVHNGAPHLARAMGSILAQTWRDFELVVCDDGSNDETPAIAASFAAQDDRVRIVRRATRSGVAAAAAWAASEARAPLIAMMHADDLAYPDRLARQVAKMHDCPDCILTGSPYDAIDWHGAAAHPANLWRLAWPSAFAPMAHSSAMYRRAAYDAAGGYRASAEYWEDLDLYWRLAQRGRILVSVAPLTTYRYSRISARQRDAVLLVERSIETMYRHADAVARGAAPDSAAAAPADARLHPRIFIASSWTRVWAGERALLLPDLVRRGRLRLDRATLESLGFVGWATVSPRSLRAVLRGLTKLRNRWARRRIEGAEWVEWNPLRLPEGRS